MAQMNILWRKNSTDILDYCSNAIYGLLVDEGATAADVANYMAAHNAANDIKAWQIPDDFKVYKAHNAIIFRSYAIKFAVGGVVPPAGAPTAIFEYLGGDEYTYFIDTETNGGEVELTLTDRNDNEIATLKAYEYEGTADFNVSAIVCTLFAADMSNEYYAHYAPIVRELYLGEVFKVVEDFFGENEDSPVYMIVNGVGQEQGDQVVKMHLYDEPALLSTGEVLYIGGSDYKSSQYVSILVPYHGSDVTISGIGTLEHGYVYNVSVESEANASAINAVLPITQKNVKYVTLSACNDILVRWVNSNGGIDAMDFPHNQIKGASVKTNQYRTSQYRRGAMLTIPEVAPFDITSQRVLTLGKQMTEQEAQMLQDMAISPFIEIYKSGGPSGTKWTRVWVEKFEDKRNTAIPAQESSIDLRLPSLNTTI